MSIDCICDTEEGGERCNLAPSEEDLLCDICREGCTVVTFSVGEHRETVHVPADEVLEALRALGEKV